MSKLYADRKCGHKADCFRLGFGDPPNWWWQYSMSGCIKMGYSKDNDPTILIFSNFGGILESIPGDWVLRFEDTEGQKFLNLMVMSDEKFTKQYEEVLVDDETDSMP